MNNNEQDTAYENDSFFKSEYKKKQIGVIVNMVTFSIGLLVFCISGINGNVYGLLYLLISWFIGGLIGSIMFGTAFKSLREKTTLGKKLVKFIMELIMMAFCCPVFIITGLIGMYRVKMQIAENSL
jgi:hypothetical protein